MATIKAYTDIEQSKKLAEILSIESADMYWWSSGKRYYIESIDDDDYEEDKDIRAWSLAALLELIRNFQPNYQSALFVGKENGYQYMSSIDSATHEYNNPVDACYEMIIKLHEQNLL